MVAQSATRRRSQHPRTPPEQRQPETGKLLRSPPRRGEQSCWVWTVASLLLLAAVTSLVVWQAARALEANTDGAKSNKEVASASPRGDEEEQVARFRLLQRLHSDDASSECDAVLDEQLQLLLLRVGSTVVGGRFADTSVEDQPVFTGFAVQRMLPWVRVRSESTTAGESEANGILVLGLGDGSTAQFFRKTLGLQVTAVELERCVITLAQKHFNLAAVEESQTADARQGTVSRHALTVHHADAQIFIREYDGASRGRYKFVLHDLYSVGGNTMHLMEPEELMLLKEQVLHEDAVLLLNHVGFTIQAERLVLSEAIAESLTRVFSFVRCYRDLPLHMEVEKASNVACFAAD